jgi:myosin heavy subunit
MAIVYDGGQWVWAPDEEAAFLPGKVKTSFKSGEAGVVILEDGEELPLTAAQTKDLLKMDIQSLSSVDDMVAMNDLNEPAILHNLRVRFKQNQIYTAVGQILVSVNPFKLLPIYTPEVMDMYKEKGSRENAPHLYGIADDAYRLMIQDANNHSCIISGESGAGKTEAMKVILQYVAEVAGSHLASSASKPNSDPDGPGMEEQILKTNPIMEAYGNAKTTRNNNSSRFGKFIEINFDKGGSILGGNIVSYLLEKSRVVFQSDQERNYHIFYMLWAGCQKDAKLMSDIKMKDPKDCFYTNQAQVFTVDGFSDEKEWDEMQSSMNVIGMTPVEQMAILKCTSAVMQMGDLNITDKGGSDEASEIKNLDLLESISELLGVNKDMFNTALTSKAIGARSVVYVPYKPTDAKSARDSTAKAIYGKVFDWFFVAINKCLGKAIGDGSNNKIATMIGILDIFGFESFETNSFEQLCINFCNEKLQFHFNEHIFKLEQDEYKKEGIPVDSIEFEDNQPTLDLIEKKRTGIFSMCDEEINVPKGSDDGFLRKVLKEHAKHPSFKKPKPKAKDSRLCFNVIHYAGEVSYNSTNFLTKNKDQLHPDLESVLKASSDPFIAALFAPSEAEAAAAASNSGRRGGRKGKGKKTLGSQFKAQLVTLMEKLNSTSPHFVRCMKPNKEKKGNIFTADMMMQQLRYSGLLEVCRIRQIGYPVRMPFDKFTQRYMCMASASGGIDGLLQGMEAAGNLTKGQYAKGKSSIFMKNQQANALEAGREAALMEVARKIQASIRRLIARAKYKRIMEVLAGLKSATKARDEPDLNHWLRQASDLPYGGKHLEVFKTAKVVVKRLNEERRVKEMLGEAIKARNISALEISVKTAKDMDLSCSEVGEAEALITRLYEEKELMDDLKAALASRDLGQLNAALEKADALDMNTPETEQCRSLVQRIQEENNTRAALKDAIASRNLAELVAYLSRMSEMGLEGPEVEEGKKLRDELEAMVAAKAKLKSAVDARSRAAIEGNLSATLATGVPESDEAIVSAQKVVAELLAEEKVAAEAAAADAEAAARLAQEQAAAALSQAIDLRDAGALKAAITGSKAQGADTTKAEKLLVKIQKEEELTAKITAALAASPPWIMMFIMVSATFGKYFCPTSVSRVICVMPMAIT